MFSASMFKGRKKSNRLGSRPRRFEVQKMTVKSESAGAAGCVVEHQADQGFAVMDFVGGDQSESFGERKPEDLDILVGLGPGDAFANVSGEINLHPLAQEAGACEVFGQQSPAFGAVARLFDHLAFGCGQGGFAW